MLPAVHLLIYLVALDPPPEEPVVQADKECAKDVATQFATALVVKKDVDAAARMVITPFLDFRGRLINPQIAKTTDDIRDRLQKAVIRPNLYGVGTSNTILGTKDETDRASSGAWSRGLLDEWSKRGFHRDTDRISITKFKGNASLPFQMLTLLRPCKDGFRVTGYGLYFPR